MQADVDDAEAESSTRMLPTEQAEAETRAEDVVYTEAESSASMQTTEESEAEMRAADVDETDAQSSGSTQTTQAWQAVFCPHAQAWYFYDSEACDETTWERPSEVSLMYLHAPAVPEPWVVLRDEVTGELTFWNEFYVEDGHNTGKR